MSGAENTNLLAAVAMLTAGLAPGCHQVECDYRGEQRVFSTCFEANDFIDSEVDRINEEGDLAGGRDFRALAECVSSQCSPPQLVPEQTAVVDGGLYARGLATFPDGRQESRGLGCLHVFGPPFSGNTFGGTDTDLDLEERGVWSDSGLTITVSRVSTGEEVFTRHLGINFFVLEEQVTEVAELPDEAGEREYFYAAFPDMDECGDLLSVDARRFDGL
jgi:hypothetical protein